MVQADYRGDKLLFLTVLPAIADNANKYFRAALALCIILILFYNSESFW